MKLKRLAALVLLSGALSMTVFGCKKHVSVPVFTYEENEDGTVTITGLTDKGKEEMLLKVPSKLDGKTVVSIGAGAFRDDATVTKVEIADGVTQICENAFLNCYSLSEIVIPETVTTVGTNVFTNTKWEHDCLVKQNELIVNNILCTVKSAEGVYTVPDNVTSIASGVFYNNDKITGVKLPDGLVSIGAYAFSGCEKLNSVTLPQGLKSIGYGAFADSAIESIDVPESVTEIGNEAFLNIGKVNYKGSAQGSPWGARQ